MEPVRILSGNAGKATWRIEHECSDFNGKIETAEKRAQTSSDVSVGSVPQTLRKSTCTKEQRLL